MFRLTFPLALFLFAVSAANAEALYWTGATSNDWSTVSNWRTENAPAVATPTATDAAHIRTTSPNPALLNQNAGTIDSLSIGTEGNTGELTLSAGGALTAQNSLYLGENGGNGTLSLAGGSASVGRNVFVGNNQSTGTLSITQGGVLNANSLAQIGNYPGGSGTVTVSGRGSQWKNGGMIIVGDAAGTGTLNITDGGAVEITGINHPLVLTDEASGEGKVLVDGADSQLKAPGGIVVGEEGNAEFHVRNGGQVSNPGTGNAIGSVLGGYNRSPGGHGVATIEGAGSHWHSGTSFWVGRTGSGTLNIRDGGTASVTKLASIGGHVGPSQATVSGSGSTWSAAALAVGNHAGVPNDTEASLFIVDGGKVISPLGVIGLNQKGSVVLSGADSSWELNDSLEIGFTGAGSSGLLILGAPEDQDAVAAGRLDAASLILYATGTLLLNHTDNSGTYTLPAPLSGDGVLTSIAGTTVLSGDGSAFAGTTTITGGHLAVAQALGGAVHITAKGTLSGAGTINGHITSEGIIAPAALAPAGTFVTLTVDGNHAGGAVHLNTALHNDASPTDMLVVRGDTAGDTVLHITNAGGSGAATTGDGIRVIHVDGASDATFSLAAPLTVGKFTYTLEKGADGHWYLQSRAAPSTATAIPVNHPAALALLIIVLTATTFTFLRKRRG